MLRLTRIHWHTHKVVEEPLYVNPDNIQWFTLGTPETISAMISQHRRKT